jgi:hypothetical protein
MALFWTCTGITFRATHKMQLFYDREYRIEIEKEGKQMSKYFKEGQTVYFYYNVTNEIVKGKIDTISDQDDVWIAHGEYITLAQPFKSKEDAIINTNLRAYFNDPNLEKRVEESK